MKVLVTGAGGYIGNAVAKELRAHGHDVWGMVRNQSQVNDLRQHEIIPVIGDLSDSKHYLEVVDNVACVIDTTLANIPGDRAAYSRELMNAVAASAKKLNIKKRYLWTSGIMTYGHHDFVVDEHTPSNTVLGQWKVNFEREVLNNPDIIGTVTRPGWVYGGTFGHYCDDFFKLNARGEIEIALNPKLMWSWIHIRDLARAYVAIIDAPDNVVAGQLYNVTDETRATYEEVRVAFAKAAGLKGNVVYTEPKPETAYINGTSIVDSAKIRRQLGWRPLHNNMLEHADVYTAAYFANHNNH